MTVVVTGAAGHIGANLVRALLAQSVPVRAALIGMWCGSGAAADAVR